MTQHFLLSSAIRDLSKFQIGEMTKDQVREKMQLFRWGSTDKQTCPACGVFDSHKFKKTRQIWRCKHCEHEFSVTSNSIFADRKMPLKKILLGIYTFINSPYGVSSVVLAHELDVNHRSAFLMLGKLREVCLRLMDLAPMQGIAEIDGGYFGGKLRKANVKKKSDPKLILEAIKSGGISNNGKRRRYLGISEKNKEKLKNRRVVIALRLRSTEEGSGAIRTITWIAPAEAEKYIHKLVERFVASGSLIVSDEGSGFSSLCITHDRAVVPHSQMFCTPEGVNQNQAESYMSRLRRMEYTIHHGMRPKYLADYAAHAARLEDDRRKTLAEKLMSLCRDALNTPVSPWWRGYFQGKKREDEILMHAF